MALEITEDFAKEHSLTPEQVTAVTGHANTWHDATVVDLKGDWDKKANTDAQGILDGALKLVVDTTKIARNDGEKAGEYIPRAWTEFSKTEQTELDKLKVEYQEKLDNFKGDEATKVELQEAKDKLDAAQKKYADYDDLVGFKDKYDTLSTEHLTMKDEVCFGKVCPKFPDTVNTFEANHKWKDFVNGVKKEWTVELVDDEPMAINKENTHKTVKLSELVDKNEDLKELLKGREQKGPGAKPTGDLVTVDGIPFQVSKETDTKTRSELIQKHLSEKGIAVHSSEYSTQFGEINKKIVEWQQTA